jgi:endonuclease-8
MPEGDTIHKVAGRLRPAIEGEVLRRIEIARHAGPLPAPGEVIETVEPHGKHLLIDFSGGLTLRVHLRMTGSWHLYQPGERWTRSPRSARVVLGVDHWTAVCFAAPDVSVSADRNAGIGHLGPDLCRPDADLDVALAALARHVDPATEIAAAMLDQRVACGVGNVYKSEVLHACRLHPRTPVADVPPDLRRRLLATAAALLQANLDGGQRTTVPEGLAVYNRAGEPCRRCGGTIARIVQDAERPRSTWWCAGCQLVP